jgi:hypothetical protein
MYVFILCVCVCVCMDSIFMLIKVFNIMLVINLNILFFRLIIIICQPEKYFEMKNVIQEYLSTQKNNLEDY